MTKLALGTVQFGLDYGITNQSGQVSLSKATQIIELARKNHIKVIDTATTYGESEAILGRIGVKDFSLVTKLPPLPKSLKDVSTWVENQLTDSLNRLGVESAYCLLIHRSSDLMGSYGRDLFRALEDLKSTRLVSKIGVSIYSPYELDCIFQMGKFDLVQAPFNLIDRRLLTSGWLSRLKNSQVEIHTRSAFLQGLLLTPVERIPAKFSSWSRIWQAWDSWQLRSGFSSLTASLAFPYSFAEVDHVVVGVESSDHLIQIFGALENVSPRDWPDIGCEDERLINPSRWSEF